MSVVAEEIGYGIVGGVAAGLTAAAVVAIGYRRKLIRRSWLQVIPIAGAGLAYGIAAALGGSGFIAAFLAGAIFGDSCRRVRGGFAPERRDRGITGRGHLLDLRRGRAQHRSEARELQIGLYAILSLTLVRMLPVAIAMIGSGANRRTVAFLGWFGPRGLASIVFGVIVVQEAHLAGVATILVATYLTVGVSVVAHGSTAAPLREAICPVV